MAQVIDRDTGEILPLTAAEAFQVLDPYSEEGVVIAQPRPDWMATISAGRLVPSKNQGGMPYPHASQNGEIYISDPDGRAPKLAEILAANDSKHLTIVFPSNDLEDFIHQRFTRRSATALEVYGDQYSITEIVTTYTDGKDRDGKPVRVPHHEHISWPKGLDEYRALKSTCKAETSVLFALGEWISSPSGYRAQVSFPDGYGWYRIRFTSRNSLQSIVGKLQEVRDRVTRGRLAGLPFELSITYREVPGPDGRKRRVPVWALVFRPPEMIKLTSGNLAGLLQSALAEGERLRLLPAPAQETLEMALIDQPAMDMDEAALQTLTTDEVPCDARYYEGTFFRAVRGTRLDSDEARAQLVREYTEMHWDAGEATHSLAFFLAHSSEREASAFIAHVDRELGQRITAPAPQPIPAPIIDVPHTEKARPHINDLRPDDAYADGTSPAPAPTEISGPFFDRPMTVDDVKTEPTDEEQTAAVEEMGEAGWAPDTEIPESEDVARERALTEYTRRMREAQDLGLNVKPWELRKDASLGSLVDTAIVIRDAIVEHRRPKS